LPNVVLPPLPTPESVKQCAGSTELVYDLLIRMPCMSLIITIKEY
jgi:hypothetical protein